MTILFIATSNAGKLRDFAAAANEGGVRMEPLPGLQSIATPPEDEPTFEGNARVKAVYYSRFATGEIVLADDSGLEVDALNGEPGVRSARYAEDAGFSTPEATETDKRNNLYLLTRLGNAARRTARYRCALAAARDGVCLLTADGTVEGAILHAPRGDGGFGYDPLFFLPEQGGTMAEIDLKTKLQFSHRGRALRSLLLKLQLDQK